MIMIVLIIIIMVIIIMIIIMIIKCKIVEIVSHESTTLRMRVLASTLDVELPKNSLCQS